MKGIYLAVASCAMFSSLSFANLGASLSESDYLKKQYLNGKSELVEGQKPQIKVATFNIGAGLANHNMDVKDVAEGIKKLNADLIGLQEVDKLTNRSGNVDQAKELAKITNMHYFFSKTIDVDGGEYGTAILSKHPIKHAQAFKMPSGDYEPRQVIVAEVNVPGFKMPIHFLNIHTDWHHQDEVRVSQMEYLNAFTTDDADVKDIFPNLLTGIMIAVGDFNDVDNSNSINKLRLFWNEVSVSGKDMRSWPAANPSLALDKIFTSRGQVWQVKDMFVPNQPNDWTTFNWPLVSDHIPVMATLELHEY
ncbi:TPA: endonuclease [Klebsiella quasipneumoniae subsp. similipneumoniae]|nr:endonuclease [Klebsiella quasipneumoniae subsp. similipneumoniae]